MVCPGVDSLGPHPLYVCLHQLRCPELRRGTDRPALVSVDPALPDFFVTRGTFQQLPVKAGSVLPTDNLAAIGVAVVKLRGTLVLFCLLAVALVQGIRRSHSSSEMIAGIDGFGYITHSSSSRKIFRLLWYTC